METTYAYTPEQLASAGKMFEAFSSLPKEEQKTVAMVANAFMQGMKASENLTEKAAANV